MKKIIAVLLSVIMLFSVVSIAVFAEGEEDVKTYYTITFVDYDGTHLGSRQVAEGGIVDAPENPSRAATDKTEYIFKGWKSSNGDENVYSGPTLPRATEDVTYTAVYAEKEIKEYLTFWKLVASVLERINKIFEYFNKIFDFDFNRP